MRRCNEETERTNRQKRTAKTTKSARRHRPDIVMNDPEGREIRLSDLRGKVVLLDFLGIVVRAMPKRKPQRRPCLPEVQRCGIRGVLRVFGQRHQPRKKAIEQTSSLALPRQRPGGMAQCRSRPESAASHDVDRPGRPSLGHPLEGARIGKCLGQRV